jgi:GDP-4-dehydro-6-deoxy-D-mannose reductase
MRVLITGATGFVGRHLIQHLAEVGDAVVGLSSSGKWPPQTPSLERLARLERIDLADGEQVHALAQLIARKQPEAIYHLAAQSNPQASLADPRGTWSTNLGGALNLLEAARDSGVPARILLVGSGVCYGNPPPGQLPVTESCPLRPPNPYAASKAAADLLGIQHVLTHDAHIVLARPFNHAGPGQSPNYALGGWARQVAEIELDRKRSIEVGNLEVVRDFTDVRDIVRAYRLLILHGTPGEAYNIGTGRENSLRDLLEILRATSRVPFEITVDPARQRPSDQPRLLADATKLRQATGWQPRFTIEQTLLDMLEACREELRPQRAS